MDPPALDDLELFADAAVGDLRDPYPAYAISRRRTPVLVETHFGAPTHFVYGYEDVARVLRDPETFSSRAYAPAMGLVMGPSILQMDGAEHHRHRALVASAFRRRALGEWERAVVAPAVEELIDRFAARGRADLVRELSFPFPIRVISAILGIPAGDEARFARLSMDLISVAADFDRGTAASRALGEYFLGLVERRRSAPREDLVSALATAEIEGERLPDGHILGFLRLLLPAGAETTYRLLGSLLFALLSSPGLLEALRADRAMLPAAIEETLRWEAPVQVVAREATRSVVLRGVEIPEGGMLTCMLGSANRDERAFEDPDRFDPARGGPAPHVAFGEGPHRCLGEPLARLEVTVALNALLDRLEDLRLEPGDRDPHIRGHAFRSPTCLPVAFRAA